MLKNSIRIIGQAIFTTFLILSLTGCLSSGGGDSIAPPPPSDTTPPSTPENLIAFVASSTEINLVWDASTDNVAVVGYMVYRDGSLIANVSSIGYSDVALIPSTEYCYTISSYDAAANESAHSGQECATTTPPPDITPPTVNLTAPVNGAIDIEYDVVISASFSEDMMSASIDNTAFTVVDSDTISISGTVSYNDATKTATFTPTDLLVYAETYTAKILFSVKDLAGNTMLSDVIWSFTTKAPQVSFTTSGSYPIEPGINVTDIVTADFNNDGSLDLALTYYQTDTVSVLLGDGTGAFGTKTDFATGDQPSAITYGYFNADSNLDMAITNGTYVLPLPLPPGTASILLGDGAGSFSAATNYEVGNRPLDISAADFNGDNITDLVTANQFSDDVSVMLGTGTGSFSSAINYSAGWSPKSVAVGDYNEDMILDLATANSTPGTVSILLGTITGTFGSETSFGSGTYPNSIKADDLNGDGHLDLVVTNDSTNIVTMLTGDGAGEFAVGIPIFVGQYPQKVSIADLNDDNLLDLVVTTSKNGGIGYNRVYVLLGHGGGSFGDPSAIYTVTSIGIELPLVTIGDFNGDTKPDLAIIDSVNDKVYIFLNTTT